MVTIKWNLLRCYIGHEMRYETAISFDFARSNHYPKSIYTQNNDNCIIKKINCDARSSLKKFRASNLRAFFFLSYSNGLALFNDIPEPVSYWAADFNQIGFQFKFHSISVSYHLLSIILKIINLFHSIYSTNWQFMKIYIFLWGQLHGSYNFSQIDHNTNKSEYSIKYDKRIWNKTIWNANGQ